LLGARKPPFAREGKAGHMKSDLSADQHTLTVDATVSQRELELLWTVANAARKMPRETPAPGVASTVHTFQIEAGVVWELDYALSALETV
jgi:hypothetical protein